MVSEDSQDLGGLPMVHRLGDLRYLDHSRDREMHAAIHQLDDLGELGEVLSLRRSECVLLEERDDDVAQVPEALHAVPEEILPVVVVPAIPEQLAASEEADKVFEDVAARRPLYDGKFWSNLPSKSHRRATVDGTA